MGINSKGDKKIRPAIKGAYGECLVTADCLSKGIMVYTPYVHDCPHDLIIRFNNIFYRVQVKYRKITNGTVEVAMRRKSAEGYKKYNDDFDILALITDIGIAYLSGDTLKSNHVTLRTRPTKNGQNKKVKLFKNYTSIYKSINQVRDEEKT